MKKLIAILLVCVFTLSVAACGNKKEPASTSPADKGGTQEQSPTTTVPAGDNQTQDSTVPSGDSTTDTTEPTGNTTPEESNKVDTPVTTPTEGNGNQGDTDIKVEINNGTSDDPVVSTTPSDDDIDNSFVIDFDQLLDASGNN